MKPNQNQSYAVQQYCCFEVDVGVVAAAAVDFGDGDCDCDDETGAIDGYDVGYSDCCWS